MPAFVPPQVDHNLYTPILPQDNVQQIFSLLDQKQELYNQGVKSAQNKISSMLNLENEVTSGPVKDMVTDFNGKANDLVKQYANLDFSLQSNVKLIDSIYDPLMGNNLFLADYSGTKTNKAEKQKALGYRDSDKKEIRDLFNMKNFNHLDIAKQNLAGAKTEREILTYASELKNSYYTPYYDAKAEVMEAFTKNKDRLTISTDYVNGQYIQTVKDGEQLFPSMNAWINTFISDKAKGQLKVEKEVDFYSNMISSNSSKEQFLSDKINDTRDAYAKTISENQELLNQYNQELNSYPAEGKRLPKQQKAVDELLQKITNTQATVSNASNTLSEYTEYMDKANKGEIELSKFYDAAERLYVQNGVQNELTNMAKSLSAFPTSSIKKNDAYFAMMTERRLSNEFAWQQKKDIADMALKNEEFKLKTATYSLETQKYYADLADKGLAYWDPQKKQWAMGAPGAAGTGTMVATTAADAQDTPLTMRAINDQIEKNLVSKIQNNNKAAIEIATAYSSLQGTPLSTVEQNQLGAILKGNSINTPIKQLVEKYGRGLFEKAGLLQPGQYGQEKGSLGDALKSMASEAEQYTKNTAQEQSGNNALYYGQLRKALDNHSASSSIIDMERENIIRDNRKALDAFVAAYPNYAELFDIDENGKIVQKKELVREASVYGIPVSTHTDKFLPFKTPGYKERYRARDIIASDGRQTLYLPKSTEQVMNAQEKLDEFLKTQKGTVGRVGSYFKEVVASDQSSFAYLRANKGDIISNPSAYHIKDEDEYEKSVYSLGWNSGKNDNTTLNTYNELTDKFFNSIPDVAYNMENKNIKRYATRVERQKGVEVIYPAEEYLKELFGLTDKTGKVLDAENNYVAQSGGTPETVKKLIAKMVQNGIRIKKDTSKDESADVIQSYLGSGLPVAIPRGNAGTNLNFSVTQNLNTGEFKLEGKPADVNDFFLKPELSYTLDNTGIKPYSESANFYNYSSVLPKQAADITIYDKVHPIQDAQIYFMNHVNDPAFIKNLGIYLQQNKIDPAKISGQHIYNFLNDNTNL